MSSRSNKSITQNKTSLRNYPKTSNYLKRNFLFYTTKETLISFTSQYHTNLLIKKMSAIENEIAFKLKIEEKVAIRLLLNKHVGFNFDLLLTK